MTLEDDDVDEEFEIEDEPPKKKRGRPRKSSNKNTAIKPKHKANSRAEERRQQEAHYMSLWREARAELKVMRQQLKVETIQESIDELHTDIAGLKRKKDEWSKFLGIENSDV
jgi:uncharacterized protein HemX